MRTKTKCSVCGVREAIAFIDSKPMCGFCWNSRINDIKKQNKSSREASK